MLQLDLQLGEGLLLLAVDEDALIQRQLGGGGAGTEHAGGAGEAGAAGGDQTPLHKLVQGIAAGEPGQVGDGLVDVLAAPLILAAAVDAGGGLQGADVLVALPAMAQRPEELGQVAAGGVKVGGGTYGNEDRYSPISIEGLGSRVDEDFLLYKNIKITDNVIMNRTTEYALYINSARDVIVTGNSFGDYVDGESEEHFTRAIHINGGMNIKIEGNTYSSYDLPVEEKIITEHNKNIYGGDVEYDGNKLIPDKE